MSPQNTFYQVPAAVLHPAHASESSDLSPRILHNLCIKVVLFPSSFSSCLLQHPLLPSLLPRCHAPRSFCLPPLSQRHPHLILCLIPTSAPGRGQPWEPPSSARDANNGPSLSPSWKSNRSSFFSLGITPQCISQPSHAIPCFPESPTPPFPYAGYMHIWRHC